MWGIWRELRFDIFAIEYRLLSVRDLIVGQGRWTHPAEINLTQVEDPKPDPDNAGVGTAAMALFG